MHTFLTPEPVTIEIRNSAGSVLVDLADVTTSSVDVVAGPSHPLGFLDDVIRAAKAQFVGGRSGGDDGPGGGYRDDRPLDDPAERVRVDLRQQGAGGESTTLIVDTDPARDGWKSSFTVHVTAPAGSGVRVQTQSANTVATGIAGRIEVRSASGDVRADQVLGRSVVQTASGDVAISDTAECDIRTASGDIALRRVRSEAQVHSTSGEIRIDTAGDDVSVRSVSGDIRVLDAVTGRAELITVSGDVEVGVHAGTLAAIDLSTVSGSTANDFVVSDEPPSREMGVDAAYVDDLVDIGAESGAQQPISGASGAAEPVLDLRVKTTSGDIRLHRAAGA
ncbi:MAG TPA: DUF4097 family beta strand repeat-containing protein [Nakamurella sp.]